MKKLSSVCDNYLCNISLWKIKSRGSYDGHVVRGCMLQCPSSSVGVSERAGNSLKNPPRTLRKMTASCCQKRDCGSKLLLSPRRSAIRCFHFCFPDAMHLRSRKRDPVPLCPCYVLWWQRRCNVRRFRMCLLWAEELPKAQLVNTAENWI